MRLISLNPESLHADSRCSDECCQDLDGGKGQWKGLRVPIQDQLTKREDATLASHQQRASSLIARPLTPQLQTVVLSTSGVGLEREVNKVRHASLDDIMAAVTKAMS